MKTCPACNQKNSDDDSFCAFCGFSIARVAPSPAAQPPRNPDSTVPASPASVAVQALPLGASLPEGSIVDGKYEIRRVLGEGGMGVVYLAHDIHTQTDVVIKAIRTEYAHRKEFKDRILAEGRSLARIDHPNVVRLNAIVVEPTALYLVMQFIEGESLDHTIERHVQMRTPIPLALSLRIFSQVLEGVAAAHGEGVIHRDLKPANVLVRAKDSVAKVTDFGIAKAEEDAKAGRGQTKGIIGSLLYMAPEQVRGQRDIDKRVDVYSLGILLFELLCGRVPFDAPSEFEVMKMHLEAPIPRLSQIRGDLPPALDEVLARACAKDRNHRFASCEEFQLAMQQCFGATLMLPVAIAQRPSMVMPYQANTTNLAQFQQASPPIHATTNRSVTADLVEEKGYSPVAIAAIAAGLIVVLTSGGLVAAWGFGLFSQRPTRRHSAGHPSASALAPVAPPASAPLAMSNLAKLVGTWKSDSGRRFDAVMSGDNLEFRIHDAADFAGQGYVAGESRFSLSPSTSEPNTFVVADKIRPSPPANTRYDLAKARSSCQEVWSSVDGQVLRAQYDGTRLTVDAAKIEPSLKFFTIQGGMVVGCTNLRNAPASRIEVVLTR